MRQLFRFLIGLVFIGICASIAMLIEYFGIVEVVLLTALFASITFLVWFIGMVIDELLLDRDNYRQ